MFPATKYALGALASAVESGDISTVRALVTSNSSRVAADGVTPDRTLWNIPSKDFEKHEINVPVTQYVTFGLVIAIARDQPVILRYFLDSGADFRDGSIASATGWCKSLEIFEVLVEKGWDVNTLSMLDTPVLGTVLKDPELVKWFLAHGPDPNFGKSGLILNLAACISTVSIFKILLQHGADISQSLPLHQAAAAPDDAGRIEMLAFLIDEMKPDVDADDWAKGLFRRLGTPLHYAIESGGIEKA
ncbi:MAG: hypothetical protein M1835_003436 [Candelina submexicana]|nr:MAG: hypothetical protein M1835_003436 [Candelina submexicana]